MIKTYRLAVHDKSAGIFRLEKRFLLFFWRPISVGTKKDIHYFIAKKGLTITRLGV